MKKTIFYTVSIIFFMFLLFLISITFLDIIKIDLLSILCTLLIASYGYFFTIHLKKLDETAKEKAYVLNNTMKIRKEIYEYFMESLTNYIFREKKEDTFMKYQLGRLKLCFYANDNTIKAWYSIYRDTIKDYNYDINDPVSKMLYIMRKEVNKESKLEPEEMAGIDPFQWEGIINRKKNPPKIHT